MACCQSAKVIAQLIEAGHDDLADQFIDVMAGAWEELPNGWDESSLKKLWEGLTGDRKHKVTACAKKLKGQVTDEWAFCASLARRLGEK